MNDRSERSLNGPEYESLANQFWTFMMDKKSLNAVICILVNILYLVFIFILYFSFIHIFLLEHKLENGPHEVLFYVLYLKKINKDVNAKILQYFSPY